MLPMHLEGKGRGGSLYQNAGFKENGRHAVLKSIGQEHVCLAPRENLYSNFGECLSHENILFPILSKIPIAGQISPCKARRLFQLVC